MNFGSTTTTPKKKNCSSSSSSTKKKRSISSDRHPNRDRVELESDDEDDDEGEKVIADDNVEDDDEEEEEDEEEDANLAFELRLLARLTETSKCSIIVPLKSLADVNVQKMEEEWLNRQQRFARQSRLSFADGEHPDCLSGRHQWHATSHARPTYCNVCRDALHGVTSHGLSCEICKCKVHKRCATKAINNCKWTTLASVGKDIIEETDGTITMPHQWIEGNLPVASRCSACDRTCGSVFRLQDWRCLWCRTTVHTQCRPHLRAACPLGPARVSVVPPTALHSIQDEAWEAIRPQASSPLLVFVNSKSGDNQGMKFLRRFKQLLNPAQVFDLISTGPRLGLRLFRHFDPFRILVCSGDGSVGWVLSEIDKLDMHKQCQVAVLPLGTGNDLARVLGWGSSCDDDTHLPQLLEKYERATTKILDRWSVMTFERTIAMPKLSLTPRSRRHAGEGDVVGQQLHEQIVRYEETLLSDLRNILHTDETSAVMRSAKRLCDTVKELIAQIDESELRDDRLRNGCDALQSKLDALLRTLAGDQIDIVQLMELGIHPLAKDEDDESDEMDRERKKLLATAAAAATMRAENGRKSTMDSKFEETVNVVDVGDGGSIELLSRSLTEKSEKDLSNFNFRKHRRTSRFVAWERDALVDRADSLKRTIRELIERTERAVADETEKESCNEATTKNESGRSTSALLQPPIVKISPTGDVEVKSGTQTPKDSLKVTLSSPAASGYGSNADVSSISQSTSSVITARLIDHLSPMPDVRRDSAVGDEDADLLLDLPAPPDFADSRRSSRVPNNNLDEEKATEEKKVIDGESKRRDEELVDDDDDRECTSLVSAISNEEASIVSDVFAAIESKSFRPRKDSNGEDVNGHIGHIDSPTTDDPCSDPLQCESLLLMTDEIRSMLGTDLSLCDQHNEDTTDDTDTTLFRSDSLAIRKGSRRTAINDDVFDDDPQRQQQQQRPDDVEELDEEEEFGFENRAFMSQHVFFDDEETVGDVARRRQLLLPDNEPIRYCSLAQFVEGNDIARRSFKRFKTASTSAGGGGRLKRTRSRSKSETYTKASAETINEVKETKENRNKIEKESIATEGDKEADKEVDKDADNDADKAEKEETTKIQFPQVSVVVEPPSPVIDERVRSTRLLAAVHDERMTAIDPRRRSTGSGLLPPAPSLSTAYDDGSFGNLSTIDPPDPQLLTPPLSTARSRSVSSPGRTRRISCCSMLNATEAAALARKFHDEFERTDEDPHKDEEIGDDASGKIRKLPIINPLVRLPTWPNVTSGTGFIGQCLLANADTLCAAVSPLIDPDETLMEGFFERCVMNNYFGIGIDAKISLDFHHKREEHPEKCRSRAKNYMWYGVLGSKQWLQKTYKNLEQRVQLECDGQRIPLPSLQGIVVLNIPSFMGGINFWGGTKEDDLFLAPSFDDKILEVVAVFGSVQMAASRLINLQHHRIAQCQSVQINILGDEGVPIQVDGEAWIQPPGIIRILHKNRMRMLSRNRALETSLKTWEEKQRHTTTTTTTQTNVINKRRQSILLSTTQQHHRKERSSATRQSVPGHETRSSAFLTVETKKRQHSFSGVVPSSSSTATTTYAGYPEKPFGDEPFGDDERHLLIDFIETSLVLAKSVKLLTISDRLTANDLYSLANRVDACLENVHPHGKLLEGPRLRPEFTELVEAVRRLYEASCTAAVALRDDDPQRTKRDDELEEKLNASLTATEAQLRRCVTYETAKDVHLVYLQPLHDDQGEQKRKGPFWLKFRAKSSTCASSSAVASTSIQQPTHQAAKPVGKKEVATWGTKEVAAWLESLQLPEYVDAFVGNDIRGRELLSLARRDLKEIGVTKVGHVKRILQAIKDLTHGA